MHERNTSIKLKMENISLKRNPDDSYATVRKSQNLVTLAKLNSSFVDVPVHYYLC
jgi:hypothetical protein